MSKTRPGHSTLDDLVSAICRQYDITPAMLRGRHRGRKLIEARKDFCRRAWAMQIFSGPEIGYAIDRDHTTVLHHCGLLGGSKKNGPASNRSFLQAAPLSAVRH